LRRRRPTSFFSKSKELSLTPIIFSSAGGHRALGVEGLSQGRWALIDYGDVIVHVFQESIRRFYDLEGLWIEAPRVDIENEQVPKKGKRKE